MQPVPGSEQVLRGREALDRAAWQDAHAAFEAALAEADTPEAHDGLGAALWFEGRAEDGIAQREQAFSMYARERRCDEAARVAVWVSHQHMLGGRPSAARGWLARAERALEGAGDCVGQGWVAVEHARHATSVEEQMHHAAQALEIARRHGADDLEVFALSVLGRAELAAGHRGPGMLKLEESMAAATAGRVGNLHTLAEAYCNLIMACAGAGEWERATEWCEHVEHFARSHRAAPLYGACRTVHADVLLATGHWGEAEQALNVALETHERYVPEMGAATVASLAELRVQQGRLADAEELLAGREESPASLRALALLRTATGREREAIALLERGLEAVGGDVARGVQLLAPLVDAHLAVGDVASAEEAWRRLDEIAEGTGMRIARARADLALTRVRLGRGDAASAVEPARRALAGFHALSMPGDTGEARLQLARALAGSAPELAADEARTALRSFTALGAQRAADSAAAFLRSVGVGTPGRARVAGALTAREHEVLELVAAGQSNADIARTLTISDRTAAHHVSRILAKLGVRNRAEAAAYASRLRDGADPPM